jgi:2C-methyl-D-erythritol 2,4-cyclodiphosphate synthase
MQSMDMPTPKSPHNHSDQEVLLQAAIDALEQVLNDGLNFSTEHEADQVLKKLKSALRMQKKR